MGKHFIFSDTHHGSDKVVDHLKKKAGDGKINVSSTGDFFTYAANDSAPDHLKHAWTDAYKKGDKDGMKKHEQDFIKNIVAPNTEKSGKKLKELGPNLEGEKVAAIMGNSDYAIEKMVGKDVKQALGGDAPVDHASSIKVETQDDTAFVYLPHDVGLLSKYKDKDYKTVKEELSKDSSYQSLGEKVQKTGAKNIVVLMHEAPKPERWYSDQKKVKSRLPEPLKAHYDSALEKITEANPQSKIAIFHGHLHEGEKKKYQYKGANTTLLDIGDVVEYDTDTGKYELQKAA